MNTIEVDVKTMYQLLVESLRYGYTRNNHLVPDGCYDTVKKYIPVMESVDPEFTIYTVEQLCEECISDNLVRNFYSGEDDEFYNRESGIKFINWCIEFVHKYNSDWKPYNYNQYVENLQHDEDKLYLLRKIDYKVTDGKEVLITKGPLSKDDVFKRMLEDIGTTQIVFHKYRDSEDTKRVHYDIDEPIKTKYIIEHI